MRNGGKTGGWTKWSKSQVDAENGDDYDVTLYDVWVNPKDGEQFYKIERIDGEDDYVVMGELGDMGEELIEEYSTLAKARARAKELVRIAESGKKMSGGGIIQDKLDDFYTLKETNEDYDENDDFGVFQKAYDYAKKHLKQSDTSKIYGMDTEGDLEWELDVKTKDVTDKIYGDAKDGYVNVSSGPGVVIIEDAGIEQILFTKDSANSFGFIQYIEARYGRKMSYGGKMKDC